MMRDHPAHRAFNILDQVLIEEAIRNSESDKGIEKARTELYKMYNSNEGRSNDAYGDYSRNKQPTPQIVETEDGFLGLEPPLGDED